MNFINDYESSLDRLLREAADHLNAGEKDEAREVLREALALDQDNLSTWELLWRAAYTPREEMVSVKRILSLDPKHAEAKKRLSALQAAGVGKSVSEPRSSPVTRRPAARQKRRQAGTLLLLLGTFISLICVGITGLALYRGGYLPFGLAANLTATALAERNASCQALIDRTIQASENFCTNTTSNTACYGNNTLQADLAPDAAQRFSERGDIIAVDRLRRLSASPLNLERNEWGIAVFKVIANLPRSLPGETVTMVVFGNATLENQSEDGTGLESFYFSSELGQIVCEKIPFDGLMVTSPDGSGIRFSINGAELTLMGNANIKAIKNGEMEVSVYQGSAHITANGEEQYFGAGQKVSVQLGGENGTEAVGGPSEPESISVEEMTMACTLTGDYCSPADIVPVSAEQAQAEIQNAITPTPTPLATSTMTRTPSPTEPPTYTHVVLPPPTFTRTRTPLPTLTRTPTRTPAPTATITRTSTPRPPTATSTPTSTATNATPPTPTSIAPSEPICGTVASSALTSPLAHLLSVNITNNHGSTITIDRFFAYWVKSPNSQKIDRLHLNSVIVWNTSDPNSPSDIPTEGNWLNGADLTIPNGATRTFLIEFSNDLQPTGYEVHLVFDIGCQVIGTK